MSKSPALLPPSADGPAWRRLKLLRDLVLQRWEVRVRAQLPAASRSSRPALRDHLPHFLEAIAHQMERHGSGHDACGADEVCRQHGRQRVTLTGYTADQVLREYVTLRKELVQTLEEHGAPLESVERELILDAIQEGMVHATEEFVRVQQLHAQRQVEETRRRAEERAELLSRVRVAHEQADEQRRRLRAVLNHVPAFIAVMRGEALVLDLTNPALQDAFPGRALDHRPLTEAVPELEPGLVEAHRRVLRTGEGCGGTAIPVELDWGDRGEPSLRYLDVALEPLGGPDGRTAAVMLFARDITEQVNDQQQLERAVRSLQEEREMRDRFISLLSHDLRTPLTAARLAAETLLRSHGADSKVQRVSSRAVGSLVRADRMIQDLLDASQVRAGERLVMPMASADFVGVVGAVVDELSQAHGPRLMLRAPAILPGTFNAEGVRRAVENLVINALKYGAPDQPVTIRVQPAKGNVDISVHNHGNPLGDEERATLFDQFRRTTQARLTGKRGWGLGLTLVRGVAEGHGGTVLLESDPGAGTTFTLRLPLHAEACEPA